MTNHRIWNLWLAEMWKNFWLTPCHWNFGLMESSTYTEPPYIFLICFEKCWFMIGWKSKDLFLIGWILKGNVDLWSTENQKICFWLVKYKKKHMFLIGWLSKDLQRNYRSDLIQTLCESSMKAPCMTILHSISFLCLFFFFFLQLFEIQNWHLYRTIVLFTGNSIYCIVRQLDLLSALNRTIQILEIIVWTDVKKIFGVKLSIILGILQKIQYKLIIWYLSIEVKYDN